MTEREAPEVLASTLSVAHPKASPDPGFVVDPAGD
jgi:hypothetical protein